MPAQSRMLGAEGRRLFSKLLLLCALGAALLLAACAQATNAGGLDSGSRALPSSAATPDAQGFTLASLITPSARAATAGEANPAPALFGGQITEMISNGGESVWQVAGRAVHVTAGTIINDSVGQPQVGAHVTVGGTWRSDGGADAAWVRVDDTGSGASPVITGQAPVMATATLTATNSTVRTASAPAAPAAVTTATNSNAPAAQAASAGSASQAPVVYCGLLEQLPQAGLVGDWRVSNRTVHVGQGTRVQAQGNRFDLGWFAYVRGRLQGDGSMNAEQIFVRPPENNRCLPGLRVGQNDGIGRGNDNGQGNGNGNGNGQGNKNGKGGKPDNPGKGNGGGKGPKDGKGKGH
ncbi:MAG: DUF5666 domain-containing protein [Nitrososphaerales archaeon]